MKETSLRIRFLLLFLLLALVALPAFGQNAPSDPQAAPGPTAPDNTAAQTKPAETKPPDPQPLPMPSMSGPLQTAIPREMEGGKLAVTGILSGIGWTGGNHVLGDSCAPWDIT